MTMNEPISDIDLNAYVDGELDAQRRIEVEAYLEANPDEAARVMHDMRVRDEIRLFIAGPAIEKAAAEMVARLSDGMTIGIGGWGPRRKPMALIREILRSDLKDLTVVAYGGADVGMLVAAGKVKKLENKADSLEGQVASVKDRKPAPKWFVNEFGSADLGGKISDPNFTDEGWRAIAVTIRATK